MTAGSRGSDLHCTGGWGYRGRGYREGAGLKRRGYRGGVGLQGGGGAEEAGLQGRGGAAGGGAHLGGLDQGVLEPSKGALAAHDNLLQVLHLRNMYNSCQSMYTCTCTCRMYRILIRKAT